MGLQDKVLPFPLALFLTSSMSHADAAKVQVGFGAVHYLWPGALFFFVCGARACVEHVWTMCALNPNENHANTDHVSFRIMILLTAFAGDTFTKSFQVKSIRNTSDGNHSVRYRNETYFVSKR
jgi:hypothetical protein